MGKCWYWWHPLTNQIAGKSVPTNRMSVYQYCFHSWFIYLLGCNRIHYFFENGLMTIDKLVFKYSFKQALETHIFINSQHPLNELDSEDLFLTLFYVWHWVPYPPYPTIRTLKSPIAMNLSEPVHFAILMKGIWRIFHITLSSGSVFLTILNLSPGDEFFFSRKPPCHALKVASWTVEWSYELYL